MSNSTQYSTLTRLLVLNNRVHDLEHQLHQVDLQVAGVGAEARIEVVTPDQIAELQEQMDRETRASLMTCWLGMSHEP